MDLAVEIVKLVTALLALLKVVLDLKPKTRGKRKKEEPQIINLMALPVL